MKTLIVHRKVRALAPPGITARQMEIRSEFRAVLRENPETTWRDFVKTMPVIRLVLKKTRKSTKQIVKDLAWAEMTYRNLYGRPSRFFERLAQETN